MKKMTKKIIIVLFIICGFISMANAQYREYYVMGKVVDINKNPIKGAEIIIINKEDNSRFKFKTNKKGEYKIAGIMHAVYKVMISKEGYKSQETEWNLSTPQARMKKVKIETIILLSEQKYKEIMLNKELKKKYVKSKKLIREGKYKEASELLSEILVKKPNEINTNYLLGVCYDKLGEFDKAKKLFEKVVELDSKFAPVIFKLAVLYQKENMIDKSIEYYKKTVEIDDKNWVAYYNLGILMFQKDKVEEAIDYFKNVEKINQKDGSTYEYLGLCYMKKGDNKSAVSYLKKAKELLKDDVDKVQIINEILKKIKTKNK
jgi:tetratricopeptide (TPR) repeat protein